MGEAILAKSVGFKPYDPLEDVSVTSGICSILVKVQDSDGCPVCNTCVNCKDGSTWYNYHTNEKGYVLFSTNSGSANITAYNFSVADQFNIVDQQSSNVMNIDAPTSTKMAVNISLKPLTENKITFTSNRNNIKFQAAKNLYVQMVGGGSGGNASNSIVYYYNNVSINAHWSIAYGGNGGCGGAYNEANIQTSSSYKYNIVIGSGGNPSTFANPGNITSAGSGGTTSGFGLSAVGGSISSGGGSGDYKGGSGGYVGTQNDMYFTQGHYILNDNNGNGKTSNYCEKINIGGGGGIGGTHYSFSGTSNNMDGSYGQYGFITKNTFGIDGGGNGGSNTAGKNGSLGGGGGGGGLYANGGYGGSGAVIVSF